MGQKSSSNNNNNTTSSTTTSSSTTHNNSSSTTNNTTTRKNSTGNVNSTTTTPINNSSNNSSANNTTSLKDEMEKLYAKYAAMDTKDPENEDDVDYIGTEGLLKFAEDIGINPEQRIMLIMLYKIGATEQYKVKHKEFVEGFKKNNCNSLSDLKSRVAGWEQPIANNNTEFKKFYVWCYTYSKEPGAKTMSCEMATATWRLVLGDRYKKIDQWCNYIENTYKKAIQKDSWDLFIDFVHNVGDDLSRYDSNDAWPVIVDDWCTLLQKQQ